jgi:hypothetical protein
VVLTYSSPDDVWFLCFILAVVAVELPRRRAKCGVRHTYSVCEAIADPSGCLAGPILRQMGISTSFVSIINSWLLFALASCACFAQLASVCAGSCACMANLTALINYVHGARQHIQHHCDYYIRALIWGKSVQIRPYADLLK